jgi:hypothetical protein
MRYLVILILLSFIIVSQSAFSYHEEREQLERSQMTGIFNSQMEMIMFPKVNQEYHLQVA